MWGQEPPEAEEWDDESSEDEERREDELEQGTSGFARRMSTPIHEAAFHGAAEAVRRLIDQGSSVDARTEHYSKTPLHEVCRRRHRGATLWREANGWDPIACFELLKAAGANLEASDRFGNVPLHYAAKVAPSLTALLIEAGVSVNVRNKDGCTPLHLAARQWHGHDKLVAGKVTVPLLLRAGAKVNATDRHGLKPMHHAVDSDNRRVVPELLRAGASIPYTCAVSPYVYRVSKAGGFKKYEQAHIARITKILAPTPRLPPEMVRKIVEFWLHAGYY